MLQQQGTQEVEFEEVQTSDVYQPEEGPLLDTAASACARELAIACGTHRPVQPAVLHKNLNRSLRILTCAVAVATA